jgi:hypothetical protein
MLNGKTGSIIFLSVFIFVFAGEYKNPFPLIVFFPPMAERAVRPRSAFFYYDIQKKYCFFVKKT